jgi:hypothetical protein
LETILSSVLRMRGGPVRVFSSTEEFLDAGSVSGCGGFASIAVRNGIISGDGN